MKVDMAKLLQSMRTAGVDAERARATKTQRAREVVAAKTESHDEWLERMRSPMKLSESTISKL